MKTLDRTFTTMFNTYSGIEDRIHNFMMDYMCNGGRIVRKEANGQVIILKYNSKKNFLYQA